jgi:hypothetical protein
MPGKIISSVDGAHYMHHPIIHALKKIYFPNKQVNVVQKAHPNASVVLFSLWGKEHSKMPKATKIMLCGEPGSTSKYNYSIIVDCKQTPQRRRPGTKFVYYPFYVWSFSERFQNTPQDLLNKVSGEEIPGSPKAQLTCPGSPKAQLTCPGKKIKFCAFMYKHSVPHRNQFFDKLCKEYKQVDALGKCCNPLWSKTTSDRHVYQPGVQTYNDIAVKKYKPYKFVLAIENELNLPGYITEKITSPMLAGAIPIYWGASEISQHFNSKSFINVNALGVDGAIQEIKRIDQDEKAYKEMLSEPWFIENKLPHFFNKDYLKNQLGKFINK